MSEETESTNDGTLSGLKKTIIGTIGTVVAGGGVWLSTLLFGGGTEEPQQVQSAAPVINITNTNQQSSSNQGKTIIIKEKSAPVLSPKIKQSENSKPKKDGDEFKEETPKW